MPFRLCHAPSSFTRTMDLILEDVRFKFVLIYIDDIIVYSTSFEEHVEHLRIVFDRLIKANVNLKPVKCFFLQTEVGYLGHVVSVDGVKPHSNNVKAVLDTALPRNAKQVRSFIGAATHYRKFIRNFSCIAGPMLDLTKKDLLNGQVVASWLLIL